MYLSYKSILQAKFNVAPLIMLEGQPAPAGQLWDFDLYLMEKTMIRTFTIKENALVIMMG